MAKRVGFRRSICPAAASPPARSACPTSASRNLDDVLTDIRRITDVCDLPLLVDVDTGFGASAFNIARTIALADQVRRRRDAHRGPGRRQALRPPAGQGARVARRRWSTASRPRSMRAPTPTSSSWRAPTRWRSKAWTRAIERARRLRRGRRRHDLPRGDHRARRCTSKFADAVKVPILANITEFGKTPLFTRRRAARAPASPSCCIRCRPSAR